MKKIGEYTAKGTMASGVNERIILFDGRFDTAYRVTNFQVSPFDIDSTGIHGCIGKLSTISGANEKVWDWGDNTEVAWATFSWDSNSPTAGNMNCIVDPDNMVVEDLYLAADEDGGSCMNYMITLEKYDISEWRGALAMVRNSAQNV